MTLRQSLIETIEIAVTDNGYWHLPPGQAEKALDAALSFLSTNTEAWGEQAWFHAGKAEHLPSLLAVLRDDQTTTSPLTSGSVHGKETS